MDFGFFQELLSIDSTSGKERKAAEWLAERLPGMFPAANLPALRVDEVGDGTLNLLLTWGKPKIVFCTHIDTVPPYISPTVIPGSTGNLPEVIKGRGSCDAKGQVFAMVTACQRLAEQGSTDFGLLLLAGEETGSWGAKAFAKTGFQAEYLVVGEPTDNCMVSASKGTKSFDLKFSGIPFHSGYPQFGVSAVDLFVEFVNALKAKDFGQDPVLGETTWNIGLVHSDNPQNILSPELTCRLYFRTTFVSDEAVCQWMAEQTRAEAGTVPKASLRDPIRANAFGTVPASAPITVTPRGGDTPARYWTVEGIPSKSVAFGSDAPHLKNFTHKAICGPGSITVAHRDDEQILVADLETAVKQYIDIYNSVL